MEESGLFTCSKVGKITIFLWGTEGNRTPIFLIHEKREWESKDREYH